jgi:20S proteasome alpha/beta subunit
MTLIVSLNCKDGLVMGSDGQATVGSSGGPIRQPIQKIYPIGKKILVSGSGHVGILQRYIEGINKFNRDLLHDGLTPELRERIRNTVFAIMQKETNRHIAFHKPLKDAGFPHAPLPPFSDLLFAILENERTKRIWRIAADGSDEFLEEIGYGCVGSGDIFAYTLLKNYNVKELDTEKGKLIAYRVIKEAIKVGAYGLGEPIDIWAITTNDIIQASCSEIMALDNTYGAWIKLEQELFKEIYKKKGEK